MQAQPHPTLDQVAVVVADVHVVVVGVALPQPFDRVDGDGVQRGGDLRVGQVQPLDGAGQQGGVRYAALQRVHHRVPGTRVTQNQVAGLVPGEPRGQRPVVHPRHAALGGQVQVAQQVLEPPALEQHRPVQLPGRVDRQQPRAAGRRSGPDPRRLLVPQPGPEVVGPESGVTTADHGLHRAVAGGQHRDPDGVAAVRGHHDGPQQLDVLQDRRLGTPGERHRGLRHRLHPEDGRQQQVAVEQVVGQVQVVVGGQVGVDDQFDTWVVHLGPVDEAQQWQLPVLQPDRRQVVGAAHHHQRLRRVRAGEHLLERGDAVLDRDRRDPVPGQCLQHAEPLAHAGAGPDRPLQCQAPDVRVVLADLAGQVSQPVVRGRVVRLTAQPGPADDAAERDQQPQRVRVGRGEYRLQAVDLRRQGTAEGRLVQVGHRGRFVAPGSVQYPGDLTQRLLDRVHRGLDLVQRRDIGPGVVEADPGGGEPVEVRRQFGVLGRVGAADQADRGTGVPAQGQRALGGDALAAAGDQEYVVGADPGPAVGGQGRRTQHRHVPGSVRVVVHLAEPGGGGHVGDHPGHRRREDGVGQLVGQRHGDHRGDDLGVFLVQGLGQARRTPTVAHRDEPDRGALRQCGPRGPEHHRDVLGLAVPRQAQQHPLCPRSLEARSARSVPKSPCRARVQE